MQRFTQKLRTSTLPGPIQMPPKKVYIEGVEKPSAKDPRRGKKRTRKEADLPMPGFAADLQPARQPQEDLPQPVTVVDLSEGYEPPAGFALQEAEPSPTEAAGIYQPTPVASPEPPAAPATPTAPAAPKAPETPLAPAAPQPLPETSRGGLLASLPETPPWLKGPRPRDDEDEGEEDRGEVAQPGVEVIDLTRDTPPEVKVELQDVSSLECIYI